MKRKFFIFLAFAVIFLFIQSMAFARSNRGDEHYQVKSCGSVIDTKTGLEWYVGPDKGTSWNQAHSWVNKLSACGGGWRMPRKAELRAIYKEGVGNRNMNHVFKTTGWWIWTSEAEGSSSAKAFDFLYGDEPSANRDTAYFDGRAFAVRSRRKDRSEPAKTQKTASNLPTSLCGDSSYVDSTSGRYQVTSCGSIIDTKTRLEWCVGPDKDTSWNQARSWVKEISACGGGWRMPRKKELSKLYEKGVGEMDIDPVFTSTGKYVWASETKDSSNAWLFGFRFPQGREFWGRRIASSGGRAFAVRSHR